MGDNVQQVSSDIQSVKDDLKKVYKDVRKSLDGYVKSRMIAYIKADPNASGTMKRAIRSRHTDEGIGKDRVMLGISSGMAPYAPVVEFGAGERTGMVWRGNPNTPVVPREWAPRLPFEEPEPSDRFYRRLQTWAFHKGLDGDIEDAATRIMLTIAEKGRFAHPFFFPAWEEGRPVVKQAAREAVQRAT